LDDCQFVHSSSRIGLVKIKEITTRSLYKNIKNSLRYPSLIGGLVKIWSTTSLKVTPLHPYIGFTEVDLVNLRFDEDGQ
jgi:hypothetical protein